MKPRSSKKHLLSESGAVIAIMAVSVFAAYMFTNLVYWSGEAMLEKMTVKKAAAAANLASGALYDQRVREGNVPEDLQEVENTFEDVFEDYLDFNRIGHHDSEFSAEFKDGVLKFDWRTKPDKKSFGFGKSGGFNNSELSGIVAYKVLVLGLNTMIAIVMDFSWSMDENQRTVAKAAAKAALDELRDGNYFSVRFFNLFSNQDNQIYDEFGHVIGNKGQTNDIVHLQKYMENNKQEISNLIDSAEQFGYWGSYAQGGIYHAQKDMLDLYNSLPPAEQAWTSMNLIVVSDGKHNTRSQDFINVTNEGLNCSTPRERHLVSWAKTIELGDFGRQNKIETYGVCVDDCGDENNPNQILTQPFGRTVADLDYWDRGTNWWLTGKDPQNICRDGYDGEFVPAIGDPNSQRLFFASYENNNPNLGDLPTVLAGLVHDLVVGTFGVSISPPEE